MHANQANPLKRLLLPLALGAALGGCAAMDVKTGTVAHTNVARVGPELPPQRSITSFSAALRCMDTTLMNYGVRDVSVLVEDLVDQTKKVNAGTKDMLISAVSDMTKRSQAVRLVAFGQDSTNLITFLQQAERKSAYAAIPEFDIRGSITQLDENVIQKQADAGFGFDSGGSVGFGVGYAKDAASNILALDLTMLSTEDFSVLPGVTSRNSVVILKEGKGIDGDATISKFGINYNMSLSKTEGQSQALRSLVELATVELFGKLTRTPYWTCLGSSPDDPEVRREIEDWFYTMDANRSELVAWFQNQLGLRGYYHGPSDGEPSDALREAVAQYRAALGLSGPPAIDIEFFRAYLQADHAQVMAKSAPPAAPAAIEPNHGAGAADQAAASLPLFARNHAKDFRGGELVKLVVQPQRDSYVYCYLHDDNRKIQRFFPNRFNRNALVRTNEQLHLPGDMRFEIVASQRGVSERVACFATDTDVLAELPPAVRGNDFEDLPLASLDQVQEAFAKVAAPRLTQGVFHVEVR